MASMQALLLKSLYSAKGNRIAGVYPSLLTLPAPEVFEFTEALPL